jgi:cobalamin biosynthesis protein CbiD
VSKQFSSKRAPIRIEILSPAENILGLDKDLHEILRDASNSCDFSSYVDKNGETRVMIECMVDEDEKERVWDLLRFKHKRDCSISSEPSELLSDTSSELITDFNDDIRVDGGF